MITFYPRDIGMWRKEFDFSQTITLIPKVKTNHKVFRNLDEFFEFLKQFGVKLDDAEFPLAIKDDHTVSKLRNIPGLQSVVQWSLLGWIKNDYR